MRMFRTLIAAGILALMATTASAAETVKIAWSHYTGWEPLGVMMDNGILAKHATANGVDVEMVFVGDYVDSITLFSSGEFNGVAVTNMDVLAIAGVGGRHSTALIVGDYSDGNDGLVLKGVTLDHINDRTVNLVEYSVSHYLLARCAQIKGFDMSRLELENTTDADIPALVESSDEVVAVSWNPMLMTIRGMDGVETICTSADIPGEIIDMVVVGDEVSPAARKALVDAWYETLALIAAGDKATLEALAEKAGSSVPDFAAQLETTHMFYTPADAVAFMTNPDLRSTMQSVIAFSFANGVYDGVDSVGELGVRFTDGSVLGDANNVMLTFDETITKAAQ